MRNLKARVKIDEAIISEESIVRIVTSLFGKRTGYDMESISEILPELKGLGVVRFKDLRLLMKKHRRAVLEDEKGRMTRQETLYLAREGGWKDVDVFSNKARISVAGLVRITMELEFGEVARVYVSEGHGGEKGGWGN